MNEKIVLIDGNSILNRAFYGIPNLTNSEGLHTNAVYGFLTILFKILEEEKPDYLTVAFDVKHPTFRHERYAEYKGTRKGMPEELREQLPMIKEVLQAMGIRILEKPGYEADDILGTIAVYCEKEGIRVALVSGDRDLLQLASENTMIRIPKTKMGGTEVENYNTNEVIEKYQVTPRQIIDLKGLMGDVSDNIPGVPGIGEKTAAKIISSFETIENAYEHIDEVMPNKARESLRDNYDKAILSKELATIKTDCELDYTIEEARLHNLYTQEAFILFKRFEFKSLLTRFEGDMSHNEHVEEKFITIQGKDEADRLFHTMLSLKPDRQEGNGIHDEISKRIGIAIAHYADQVFGAAFSFNNEESYYIPTSDVITKEYLLSSINAIIKADIPTSFLNLKEVLPYLQADENSKVYDMGVAAYLMNPLKDTYHYDDIARDFLSLTVPSREELVGKLNEEQAFTQKGPEYARVICYQSYIAYTALTPLLEELNSTESLDLYMDMEMPLIFTLYDMEVRGIRVNREALKEYGDKLKLRITELEKCIYNHVGEEFNINSPKQLGVILFDKMHMPFGKKTKTGYSTSADILEKLRCEDPVIDEILEYRQLTKLKSTYADGLASYISKDDNRIHGKFNQTITATGRISSTDPNLQNIPIRMALGREIRKVFIPEEDFVFLDADYSQIELRVLAHMSSDERLIEAYKQEEDIHKITASQVFHTPLDQVTSAQRSDAKAVNFGIVYGISSFGLGQDLNITRKEAETYIKQYFATYPKVKNFLDDQVENARKNGYVTSLFGRRRPVPELSSSNFMQRSFGERVAMNSPIQGTAADIIKVAMVSTNRKLKSLGLRSRLILQIHDELLIETHKDEVTQVSEILSQEMQSAANLNVPLEIEVKQGSNWFEAK